MAAIVNAKTRPMGTTMFHNDRCGFSFPKMKTRRTPATGRQKNRLSYGRLLARIARPKPISKCTRGKQVSEFVVDTGAWDRLDRQQRHAYDQRCKPNHDHRKPTSARELDKTAFQRLEPPRPNIRENKSNQHRQQYKTRLD